jgi:hypothetical protein
MIMAKINFIVKSTKKGSLATVYLRFTDKKVTDLTVTTPKKIYPEYWSLITGELKQRIVFDEKFTEEEKLEFEKDLTDLKDHVFKKYNELVRKGNEPTKDWLKNVIDNFFNTVSVKDETLNQYIARFINETETGKRLSIQKGMAKRYAKNTVKAFKSYKFVFDEYQKSKNIVLNFAGITIDFYDKFVSYFTTANYRINTIGKYIKILKTIMRAARDEGLHTNSEIERKRFQAMKTDVQDIYLTDQELTKLFKLDLSENKTWEIVRDVFLVGCYTAQRYSDFSKINPNNIRTLANGSKIIFLIQKKTNENVLVNIKPELETILKKYNYQIPKTFEQKINLHIKDICKKAGITEPVELKEFIGGLEVQKFVSKNELVKTHTARRSGCTLMYLAGIPIVDIMKISGHRSQREFLNYIKVSKEETAEKLSTHPYFTDVKLTVAK